MLIENVKVGEYVVWSGDDYQVIGTTGEFVQIIPAPEAAYSVPVEDIEEA